MKKLLSTFIFFTCIIIQAHAQPPSIEYYLAQVEIIEGGSETIGGEVEGETSIEWRKDGTAIPGATAEVYRIENATLSDAGTYTLTASNADGSSSAEIIVEVRKNTAPEGTIGFPTAGTTFTPGSELHFGGSAVDGESEFVGHEWRLEYHSGDEVSPGPDVAYIERTNSDRGTTGWFDIPTDVSPEPGDFYRMYYTVSDHMDLTDTDTVDVPWSGISTTNPTITFETNPRNLRMMVDGNNVVTQHEMQTPEGSEHTIAPVAPQTYYGTTYVFSNWAHGGPPSQTIITPAEDAMFTANYSSALTGPWRTTDVGAVNVSGFASFHNGQFTLAGSGKDIWEDADAFHFVYRSIEGDVDIRARVTSLTNTHHWAKAGVMIRNSTDPRSKHLMTVITPGNGASFQRRLEPGRQSSATNAPATAPYWVRLVKNGSTFTSYISSNGTDWTMVGTPVTTPVYERFYVGLVVTSHTTDSHRCHARFTEVTVSTPVSAASGSTVVLEGSEESFDVYPNPVTGNTLRVKLHGQNAPARVQVVNMLGQVFYEERFEEVTGDELVIDAKNVPQGVYLVRVSDARKVSTRSIVRK